MIIIEGYSLRSFDDFDSLILEYSKSNNPSYSIEPFPSEDNYLIVEVISNYNQDDLDYIIAITFVIAMHSLLEEDSMIWLVVDTEGMYHFVSTNILSIHELYHK